MNEMNNGQSELITQQLEEHEQESQSEHEDELEHADEQLGDTTATTLNSEVAKDHSQSPSISPANSSLTQSETSSTQSSPTAIHPSTSSGTGTQSTYNEMVNSLPITCTTASSHTKIISVEFKRHPVHHPMSQSMHASILATSGNGTDETHRDGKLKEQQREERLRLIKERREQELRKRKDDIEESLKRKQELRERQLRERQKKIDELRQEEAEKRAAVIERKKMREDMAKAKLESFIKREQEKESQREKKQAEKKQKSHSIIANATHNNIRNNTNQTASNIDAINKSLSEFNLNSMSSSVVSHKRSELNNVATNTITKRPISAVANGSRTKAPDSPPTQSLANDLHVLAEASEMVSKERDAASKQASLKLSERKTFATHLQHSINRLALPKNSASSTLTTSPRKSDDIMSTSAIMTTSFMKDSITENFDKKNARGKKVAKAMSVKERPNVAASIRASAHVSKKESELKPVKDESIEKLDKLDANKTEVAKKAAARKASNPSPKHEAVKEAKAKSQSKKEKPAKEVKKKASSNDELTKESRTDSKETSSGNHSESDEPVQVIVPQPLQVREAKVLTPEEEEYKRKLDEKRREAREKAAKEAELERLRQEELRRQEDELAKKQEELERLADEEEMRWHEMASRQEEERLRLAIFENEKLENERRLKEETERKAKEEADKKAREETDRLERERIERARKEDEERMERKKKLDSIMNRFKKDGETSANGSSGIFNGSNSNMNSNGTNTNQTSLNIGASSQAVPTYCIDLIDTSSSQPHLNGNGSTVNGNSNGSGNLVNLIEQSSASTRFPSKTPLLQSILSKTRINSIYNKYAEDSMSSTSLSNQSVVSNASTTVSGNSAATAPIQYTRSIDNDENQKHMKLVPNHAKHNDDLIDITDENQTTSLQKTSLKMSQNPKVSFELTIDDAPTTTTTNGQNEAAITSATEITAL